MEHVFGRRGEIDTLVVFQVIGVKDERLGEQVCACIKLTEGQTSSVEEIRDFCQGQVRVILQVFSHSLPDSK